MKKRSVKDRAMLANEGDLPVPNPPTPEQVMASPKTAPGSMMAFISQKSEVHALNAKLQEKVSAFKDAAPTRKINPNLIVRSKWSNRHEESFSDSEFLLLKADIESADGNVQPIKVRRISGDDEKYEIVFGHRRHQACLELGIPVLAMIDAVSDQDLFIEMDRENRQRKDLRPYEQGLMYKKVLDEGLFPSAKKLAASVGADVGSLGRALALARLPDEVLQAFNSPLDIHLRWSSDLTQALQKDPELVFVIAKKLQQESPKLPAKQVFEQLVKVGGRLNLPPPLERISIAGVSGQSGIINVDSSSDSAVVFLKNIDLKRIDELKKIIQHFLN